MVVLATSVKLSFWLPNTAFIFFSTCSVCSSIPGPINCPVEGTNGICPERKRILPGFDWAIVRLAAPGEIKKILVDTNHFKGNYPDMCSIEGCYRPDLADNELTDPSIEWTEILPKTKLQAHTEHFFEEEIKSDMTFTHVRLNIFPDGGISRLRLFGVAK